MELGAALLTGGIDREAESDQEGVVNDQWSEYDDSVKVKLHARLADQPPPRAVHAQSFTESGALSLALTAAKEVLTLRQTDIKLHMWRRSGRWRPFFETTYRRETTKGETDGSLEFADARSTDFVVEGLSVPGNTYTVRGGVTLRKWLGAYTFEYEYRRSPRQSRHVADLRRSLRLTRNRFKRDQGSHGISADAPPVSTSTPADGPAP